MWFGWYVETFISKTQDTTVITKSIQYYILKIYISPLYLQVMVPLKPKLNALNLRNTVHFFSIALDLFRNLSEDHEQDCFPHGIFGTIWVTKFLGLNCNFGSPIYLIIKLTSVWLQISQKIVNTVWFRFKANVALNRWPYMNLMWILNTFLWAHCQSKVSSA